jgi:hypothetical protein
MDLIYCKSCKFVKNSDEFYVSNQSRCKSCVKARVNQYRSDNIESIRRYDRERGLLPHRIKNSKETTAKWRKENPKWWSAQIILNYALRIGKVQKEPCFICGEKAVAHHPDYDHPLDVVWLCQSHHKQAHALSRKAA